MAYAPKLSADVIIKPIADVANPDMLHSGILPHRTKWAKCFENLRYVVIDELTITAACTAATWQMFCED